MDRMEFIKLLQSNRDQALPLLAEAVAESIVTPLEEAKRIVKDIVTQGYTALSSLSNDQLIWIAQDCQVIVPLIKVKLIWIDRAEGLHSECGKPVTILAEPGPYEGRFVLSTPGEVWNAARHELSKIAQTAPKGGCYDKTDFKIEWTDGQVYDGRADVKHISEPDNDTDLSDHVWGFITFHIGKRAPAWMGEKKYREFMEQNRAYIAEFEGFYYLYDLGMNTY
jgi:hypothetical protein